MFDEFGPGRPPQAPGPSKSQKSDPKYACQQILSPNCPQNGKFWEGRSPLQFPGEEIPPTKKLGILTISPTKNPGNATERRVLKSYYDGFQSQTKRCHLSQVMLISVSDTRFGVGIRDAQCLGELVWVS